MWRDTPREWLGCERAREDAGPPQPGAAATGVCVIVVLGGIAWDLGALPGTTKTVKLLDGRRVTRSARRIVGPRHTPSGVPLAVETAFGGYERGPYCAAYRQLISTMEGLSKRYGCGRLMPEFDPTGRYGSVCADNLLPCWTNGCIATVTGLYDDSAPGSAVALVAESASCRPRTTSCSRSRRNRWSGSPPC